MGSLWGPQEGPRQWSVGFNAPEVGISAGKCIGKCVEVPKINWFEMRFSGCVGNKLLDPARLANGSGRTQGVSCKLREKNPWRGLPADVAFPEVSRPWLSCCPISSARTSYTYWDAGNGGAMQPSPAAEQLDVGSACSSTGERFLPWLQWETCLALSVPTDVLYHHSPS